MSAKAQDDANSSTQPSSRVSRVLKLAFVLLGLLLGGFALAAWLGGEPDHLPFEYEGFD